MEAAFKEAASGAGVGAVINRVGSMMTLFFTRDPVHDYASAKRSDTKRYAQYFHAMLSGGVNLPPSQFEAFFVSTAHTEEDIDRAGEVARGAMEGLT